MRALSALTCLLLLSCGGGSPPGVDADRARRISLLDTPTLSLSIPETSRPNGKRPGAKITLRGWTHVAVTPAGKHKWATDVPIRPRGLFFQNAQPGMQLADKSGKALRYNRACKGDTDCWSHDLNRLYVYLQTSAPPTDDDFGFRYARAAKRELALNYALSDASKPEDFIRAEVHDGWQTRTGLYLPAPGSISWKVEVPEAAELLLTPGLVAPEWLDAEPSDGATLVVEVDSAGTTTEVSRIALKIGTFDPVRVNLSKWAGEQITLRLNTLTDGTATFDYAFLGEPQLASVRKNPRRVLLIFVDTLRPDHMSLYGYKRDTSAMLDVWAKDATVFENARSVAPWTLPSARSVLTGRHPEHYGEAETLQKTLSDEGFVTAMFAGNIYLSTNFEMARDWGLHQVGMFPSAKKVTDDALAWLDAREGHDALLQVHYMDAHLPYLEPKRYRSMYAGDARAGLGEEFHLTDVRRANPRTPEDRGYVIGRYDNNVRFATDQVARLLERMDDNDIVVFYADHGEELWDHGGFEHGHQLYDELLRVPLVIKTPGISGSRIDAPASLLDITPTVLDALGLSPDEALDGISLLSAARGEASGLANMRSRTQAFGRPLYGTERWGVLTPANQKWTTHEGRQSVFDLTENPTEDVKRDLFKGLSPPQRAAFPEQLSSALGRPAGQAFHLAASQVVRGPMPTDLVAMVSVPGGVQAAWAEHDPLGRAGVEVTVSPDPDDATSDLVRVVWKKTHAGQGIAWILPNQPIETVTHRLKIEATLGEEQATLTVRPELPASLTGPPRILASAPFRQRRLTLKFGISAVANEGLTQLVASDPEVNAELKALGYLVDDE